MTFDARMTFEKHLRSVSKAASQRIGIFRKSWRVFHDQTMAMQPVAVVLEYLVVKVSSISCIVVGSILALHAWKALTQQF